ncbi:uncharacterized protein LOC126676437 [Mercurialis annua]|uniref:uncharacterized protein LOC126676437 n=1 Tax=Mercurialis annua TaxID=3986 RepID=UPI00215F80D5|nr:uncharacterized protein LOC126676437 [Mercurialis annua]
MGMGSNGEVVIFTDTSIDTHIALSVSPDITAADFMRELETTHYTCLPTVGEIKAHALMVRKRKRFYRLSESLPLKCVFQGVKGAWFLHVQVEKVAARVAAASACCDPRSSSTRIKRSVAVGSRIMTAANNIRLSGNKPKPILSFFALRAVSTFPMFEISDSDH